MDFNLFNLFIRGYLNDLFAPLVLLAYSNFLLSHRQKSLKNLGIILLFISMVGLFWEYGARYIKPSSTADLLDLVCYEIGAMIYWYCLKHHNKKNGH